MRYPFCAQTDLHQRSQRRFGICAQTGFGHHIRDQSVGQCGRIIAVIFIDFRQRWVRQVFRIVPSPARQSFSSRPRQNRSMSSAQNCAVLNEKRPVQYAPAPFFTGGACQTKNCAPLADMVEPLMKPDSSDARNTTQRAISSGSPRRPAGIWAMILSRTFSGTAMTISVPI